MVISSYESKCIDRTSVHTWLDFVLDEVLALGVQEGEVVLDELLLHLLVHLDVRGRVEKAPAAQVLLVETSERLVHERRAVVLLEKATRLLAVVLARLLDEHFLEQRLVQLRNLVV